MNSGPELFCRYAQPPNLLGYCGPDDHEGVATVAGGLALATAELTRIARAFEGAWPYLELIGALTKRPPLGREVVEAYWIGNTLLDNVDLLEWGNSVSDRFRLQAGARWDGVAQALDGGGQPNHAFHVFCVYPWVGLLREGFTGPSLEVLDRCRIGWGTVVGAMGDTAEVRRRPLIWLEDSLRAGEAISELFRVPSGLSLTPGETVSLHWDFVCQRLDESQEARLRGVHDRHLAIANEELRWARLEPSR